MITEREWQEIERLINAMTSPFKATGEELVSRKKVLHLLHTYRGDGDLSDCVEYVMEDGRRFAWSESNIHYEEVPEDGGSFTVLRNRLKKFELMKENLETALRSNVFGDDQKAFVRKMIQVASPPKVLPPVLR